MQIMPFHIEGGLYERLGFSRTADRDNPRAQIIAGTHILYNHIARYISPAEVDWYTDMETANAAGIINYGGYQTKNSGGTGKIRRLYGLQQTHTS